MVQISRRKIDSRVWDKMFYLFFEILGKKQSRNDFDGLISGVLSETERIVIAKRITICYLLVKGIDTNSICDLIKVTRATVAKSSIMLSANPLLKKLYQRNIRNERVRDLFVELLADMYGPGNYGANWKVTLEVKKSIQKKKQTGI